MESTQHRPTLRVLEVLELLSQNDEGYILSEISSILSIPKGSLHPIIQTLQDKHYIGYDRNTQRYSIGLKCYEVGNKYLSQMNVLDEIRDIAKKVVAECKETCHFAILNEKDVIYLLKEESNETIRMVSSIGKRIPAHSTAIGKALLSGFTVKQLEDLYSGGLSRITENTITDIHELCRQIEEVRKGKVAFESEESSLNVTCIAVPIEKDGNVVAAMSVSVPVFRATDEKKEQIRQILLQAKQEAEGFIIKVPFHL